MYTSKEQAWNGNTIDLLTDHRSSHQWLLWLAIAIVQLIAVDVHSACDKILILRPFWSRHCSCKGARRAEERKKEEH